MTEADIQRVAAQIFRRRNLLVVAVGHLEKKGLKELEAIANKAEGLLE